MQVPRIISLMTIVFIIGCYYDVEEEIYPTLECDSQDMSYINDIVGILQQDCYVCHSAVANNGNVTLEGYDQIINYVNNGRLLGAIKHESGFSAMPKNQAKLLDCEIEKIESWILDGAPNN